MSDTPTAPVFAVTDPWLRSELGKGRGYRITAAQRFTFLDNGAVEFVCPSTGEVLTGPTTPRGVRRALNRLHDEAVKNPAPPPEVTDPEWAPELRGTVSRRAYASARNPALYLVRPPHPRSPR